MRTFAYAHSDVKPTSVYRRRRPLRARLTPAVTLDDVDDLLPGERFAGCRIEAVAGRGGMGVVYRATQLALSRRVALKVVAPEGVADRDFIDRFGREVRMAASIDHPNIVPVYGAGEEAGRLYLVMRYVDGTDLQALVRRAGRIEPARAAGIVAQVAAGLDAAHASGLVHRDVKPANVLLTVSGGDDHVYLTDFGLTVEVSSGTRLTTTGHWIGSVDYMSPEQLRAEPVDARTDVYALGGVLFAALTGQAPFSRGTVPQTIAAQLNDPPPRPTDVAPVDPAFDAVVARALAKDPADRYRSAGDLGRAAQAAARGERVTIGERTVARGPAAPSEDLTSKLPARIEDPTSKLPGRTEDPTSKLPGRTEDPTSKLPAPVDPAVARGSDAAAPRRASESSPAGRRALPGPPPGAPATNGAGARGQPPGRPLPGRRAPAPGPARRLPAMAPRPVAGAVPGAPAAGSASPRPATRAVDRDADASKGDVPRPVRRRRARRRALLGLASLVGLAAAGATVGALIDGGNRPRAVSAYLTADEVRGVAEDFAAAYGEEDAEALRATLTRTVQRVAPDGEQRGRETVLGVYRRQFAASDVDAYDLDDLDVAAGAAGRAAGRYTVRRSGRDDITGRVAFGVVREGERPRIALIATDPD
jgi:serine/threonine protein kinase